MNSRGHRSALKNPYIAGIVLVIFAVALYFGITLTRHNAPPSQLALSTFKSVSAGIDAHIGGHPIDSGYDPAMFMGAYPGLIPEDFDRAEATQGWYHIVADGNLEFHSTAGNHVSTAERGLTISGIMQVLHRAAARLSLPLASEGDVDVLLLRLGGSSTSQLPSPIISAAKVPDGWYSHQSSGYDGEETILTKTPGLPKADPSNYAYGEHIAVVERYTSLTPEEYLKQTVYMNLDNSSVEFARWGTLYGRKMFSIGFTNPNDGSKEQSIYLFGDDQFILVNLYPDKQENRAAFQQVVNYYAQTLPMISREETQASCKTHDLPPGQEYDIQTDSETGYVTLGYWLGTPGDTQESYLFLNYNDDLSQCSPDIGKILSSARQGGNKIMQ